MTGTKPFHKWREDVACNAFPVLHSERRPVCEALSPSPAAVSIEKLYDQGRARALTAVTRAPPLSDWNTERENLDVFDPQLGNSDSA